MVFKSDRQRRFVMARLAQGKGKFTAPQLKVGRQLAKIEDELQAVALKRTMLSQRREAGKITLREFEDKDIQLVLKRDKLIEDYGKKREEAWRLF